LCRNAPAKALAEDAKLAPMDKKGAEKKYGEFRAKVLGDLAKGTRLVHAMLLPRKEAAAKLKELEKNGGRLEMPGAIVQRQGEASVVTIADPRYLNAETTRRSTGSRPRSMSRCSTRRRRPTMHRAGRLAILGNLQEHCRVALDRAGTRPERPNRR
jgi:hypothetical protein